MEKTSVRYILTEVDIPKTTQQNLKNSHYHPYKPIVSTRSLQENRNARSIGCKSYVQEY